MRTFPVRLYINGRQSGDDATYSDRAPTMQACADGCKQLFEEQGYAVEISIETVPRWPEFAPEPTVIVRCTTLVRS